MELLQNIDWSTIFAIVSTIAYIITRALPELPVTWTSKIPDTVMVVLNWLANKHKIEKAAKTDMKGNAVE